MVSPVVANPSVRPLSLLVVALWSVGFLSGCAGHGRSTASPAPAPSSRATAEPSSPWQDIPSVALHTDLQQASVREAIRSSNHPERLSLLSPSTPFDLAAYRRHPEAYLDVIEPGRAMQPAPFAPSLPALRLLGASHPQVASLGVQPLRIQASPRAPVTFTSLDRGRFENGLTSLTLQADDQGQATAHFTATAGTVAECRVLAASPMATGRARWVIAIRNSSDHRD